MKFKIFCLAISVSLLIQSCSITSYPLLHSTSNSCQNSEPLSSYSNLQPENITVFQANAKLVPEDYYKIQPAIKEDIITNASLIIAEPPREQKTVKSFNKTQVDKVAENAFENKLQLGSRAKRLKKNFVSSENLPLGRKHALFFVGLSLVLILLILYGPNVLVTIGIIIGIILGAVLAILLLLFLLFASGIFGKMSG